MNFHLYAIGNALVDTEYEVSDALLHQMQVSKRHMTLIDRAQRSALEQQVAHLHARRTGGGSAGNTVVALAQLGGQAYFSCRVADDELGRFYHQDLRAQGVASRLDQGLTAEGETGSCMVLVTPDAERTMCTCLGATAELDRTALDAQALLQSAYYYMEGYLAASPTGLQAALDGLDLARQHGVRTALTLSDVSMIRFCRTGLEAMLAGGLDCLFANEEEAQVWCDSTDPAALVQGLSGLARTVCLTQGAKGSLVITDGRVQSVPAVPVKALDTNGAGDMFAGSFLYGITHGMPAAEAAHLANRTASAVVGQYGNRLTRERMQALLTQSRV